MVLGKNIVTASALRNASIYYQSPEFVAGQVFPVLNANDPTMKITKYLASDYFRNDAGVRGEGGEAKRGGFKTTEVTYSTIETAYAVPITDELRRNVELLNGDDAEKAQSMIISEIKKLAAYWFNNLINGSVDSALLEEIRKEEVKRIVKSIKPETLKVKVEKVTLKR